MATRRRPQRQQRTTDEAADDTETLIGDAIGPVMM